MNRLCPNPLPHTWILVQKMHDGEFIYPIVSEYAKRHKGEQEDTSIRTMRVCHKYDNSKVIQRVSSKEGINLYGTGQTYEIIMKVLCENNLESRVNKVFDLNPDKIGLRFMGKEVFYLNDNTLAKNEEILICRERRLKKCIGKYVEKVLYLRMYIN